MHQRDPGIAALIGGTPLIRLNPLLVAEGSEVWLKLEGQNPGGSVKDRAAYSMIHRALERGEIQSGDRLIEATSGNTGIALAMVCAILGMRLTLIMPSNQSAERKAAMQAYGAELLLVSPEEGMEGARDKAQRLEQDGYGKVLDQFNNPDNPRAHYETTGPEIWSQTGGRISHFVSAMGTTGTITGVARYLREQSNQVRIVGLQPAPGSQIPGIRRWPEAYRPRIFEPALVDEIVDVAESDAVNCMRVLAERAGIFCGVSSGGAVFAALQIAAQARNCCIVAIICDRGDRYLSTGVFQK